MSQSFTYSAKKVAKGRWLALVQDQTHREERSLGTYPTRARAWREGNSWARALADQRIGWSDGIGPITRSGWLPIAEYFAPSEVTR
jgi:hypothetical protein